MFLSSKDIAQNHQHTLNNLLSLATTCLNAGQRLNELAFVGGRSLIAATPQDWKSSSAQAGQLLTETIDLFNGVQHALISHSEIQIRHFDEMLISAIGHAEKFSPCEAMPALCTVKSALISSEQMVHELSVIASEAIPTVEPSNH